MRLLKKRDENLWEKGDHSDARFDLCTVYTNNFFRCLDRVTCHVMSCDDGDKTAGWSLGRQWQNGKESLKETGGFCTV